MKDGGLLDEIKSHVDIVDFISDYVSLKKSGQNYRGLCPFHTEKTPSFMVSRVKQIFHCFGCGAGGDVVTFLMRHENLPFTEAMRSLAKKVGIAYAVGAHAKIASEKRHNILHANEEAMKYYAKILHDSPAALDYLRRRGLSTDSLLAFGIGYAKDQQNALFTHLKRMGIPESTMVNAGLVARHGKEYRDWFRGRIMFPIVTIRNDVIAFGGRVMSSAQPKYINTSETELFKKSDTLFGINHAKREIHEKKYALIVEGYLDTIMCHQHGFRNAIAALGTSLTARHVQRLKSLTDKIVLVFDGDDAGTSAARRSLAICCEQDMRAEVIILPRGEDPDSLLRKGGGDALAKILLSSRSLIEFLMLTARGERVNIVREALSFIALMRDMLHADELLRELADRSKMNEGVLRSELQKMMSKPREKRADKPKQPSSPIDQVELILLSALLAFPEKRRMVLPHLILNDIRNETIRGVLQKIAKGSDDADVGALLVGADDAERNLVTGLILNPGFDPEHVDANIADCLLKLRLRKTERERQRAEDEGDVTRLDALLKEKRKYMKQTQV